MYMYYVRISLLLSRTTVSISRHIYLGFCRYCDSRENRCCVTRIQLYPLCYVKHIRRILLLTGAPLVPL